MADDDIFLTTWAERALSKQLYRMIYRYTVENASKKIREDLSFRFNALQLSTNLVSMYLSKWSKFRDEYFTWQKIG